MAPGARDAEEDDLGHLLGGHHPFEDVRRSPVAVLEREIGRDAARADVRAAHAVLAELVIEGACEPHLAELRRAVDGLARQSTPSRLGGDGDEVAFAARHEVRDCRTGRVDRALEVDVDHLIEVVERRVDERVVRPDARVGDADVEPAEALDRLRDRVLDLLVVANVAAKPDRVRQTKVVSAARREPDRHALVRERSRDGCADPTTRARDERHLAVKPHPAPPLL